MPLARNFAGLGFAAPRTPPSTTSMPTGGLLSFDVGEKTGGNLGVDGEGCAGVLSSGGLCSLRGECSFGEKSKSSRLLARVRMLFCTATGSEAEKCDFLLCLCIEYGWGGGGGAPRDELLTLEGAITARGKKKEIHVRY